MLGWVQVRAAIADIAPLRRKGRFHTDWRLTTGHDILAPGH